MSGRVSPRLLRNAVSPGVFGAVKRLISGTDEGISPVDSLHPGNSHRHGNSNLLLTDLDGGFGDNAAQTLG